MEKPQHLLEFEKPIRDLEKQLEHLRELALKHKVGATDEIAAIEAKIETTKRTVYRNLTAWQRVQTARHPKRPYALDYIGALFRDFQELHGDRQFNDDRALIGGTAFFHDRPVMIVAQQKGRDTKENLVRNFGMPNPEGYRKALRLMRLAEKFGLPVICFIDTPGAFPGIGSEERHVAEAIAVNIREMAVLRTPSIAIVIGEGGSGGALGIGVADRILVFENSYYSVISPEGCAAILWKDRAAAEQAAAALKLNAAELTKMGIAHELLAEPLGGAHYDPAAAARTLDASLQRHLDTICALPLETLLEQRYQFFRHLGQYAEAPA
ncbi:MAG: acetyl-CoA carboxylase carboxyltransferase subunit alpha [Opitutaceae bacterium]|nr:acetyl-CoA carboxylase carboxyltransferase subunit alpha [Opitutaceae bacterium]